MSGASESQVQEWLRDLACGDLAVVAAAVDGLAAEGSRALPGVYACLRSEHFLLRYRALRVIGRVGDRAAGAAVAACLGDPDEGLRCAAVRTLGALGGERALLVLGRALTSAHREVREAAVGELLRSPEPEALWLLGQNVEHLAERHQLAVIERLVERAAAEALWPLTLLLSAPSTAVRVAATRALGRIGALEAVPLLCHPGALEPDEVHATRQEALGRIAMSNLPALIDRVLELEAGGARCPAGRGAIVRQGSRAAPELDYRVWRGETAFQVAAVELLGELGVAGALAPLTRALRHRTVTVRSAAILALGRFGAEAEPALRERLALGTPEARGRAALVLAEAGCAGLEELPTLLLALRDSDRAVRERALGVLETWTEEQPSPRLREALPALSRLLGLWARTPRELRARIAWLMDQIELATFERQALPVPARGETSTDGLPVPAAGQKTGAVS